MSEQKMSSFLESKKSKELPIDKRVVFEKSFGSFEIPFLGHR